MRISDSRLALLALSLVALPASHHGQALTTRGHGQGQSAPALSLDAPRSVQLAGNSLSTYPWFEHVRSFNDGDPVELGLDTGRFPELAGLTVDVWVVEHRTALEWEVSGVLDDVRGMPTSTSFAASGIQSNRFLLDPGTLSSDGGTRIALGYDIVIDINANGVLDPDDWIDGPGFRHAGHRGRTSEAGFYVVRDLSQPGPLNVTEVTYSGGSFLGQNTFYPTDIASLGRLPLVVVSHGNGHNYQWYDHIGTHLASYGYIVMSHQNNTMPGPNTAATTTLTNTAYLLENQGTIQGGVLAGHVDGKRITWIGHSRGAEGVARAVDRLFDGTDSFASYDLDDIALVSNIAPTDFYGVNSSNPHGKTFHLWTGGADADVNGCASCELCETFHLYDRAEGTRFSTSYHGVGHGDFHNGGGSSVASGPCLVGRTSTHALMKGQLLALIAFVVDGQPAGEDYLWRQHESFRHLGTPNDACIVVDSLYQPGPDGGSLRLDDFQTETSDTVASSGGAVSYTVQNLLEDDFDDSGADSSFSDNPLDPMNGMTQGRAHDFGRGIVFDFDGAGDYDYAQEVPAGSRDLSRYEYLSFRAAQATRHPFTVAALEDLTFEVRLEDGSGHSSTIGIGAYGGGIEEPYQRGGCGTGFGWGNEFETIRMRLGDFANEGSGLDLTDIATVRFLFGPSHGSAVGRLGLDDIQFDLR